MKTPKHHTWIAALLCTVVAAVSAATSLVVSAQEQPAIAGDWTVYFQAMGHEVSGKLHLDVDGEKLSGTVETEHTGPGKLQDGKWSNNKLSTTLVFERHESILFEGERKDDGTLSGQYKTEGRTDTWRAERGPASASPVAAR